MSIGRASPLFFLRWLAHLDGRVALWLFALGTLLWFTRLTARRLVLCSARRHDALRWHKRRGARERGRLGARRLVLHARRDCLNDRLFEPRLQHRPSGLLN